MVPDYQRQAYLDRIRDARTRLLKELGRFDDRSKLADCIEELATAVAELSVFDATRSNG